MVSKAVFFCLFGFLVQSITGQSCYRSAIPKCGCGSGRVAITVSEEGQSYQPLPSNRVSMSESYQPSGYAVPSDGGAFTVTSIGPIAPAGIAVATDLGLSGDLVLSGVLPYLSAVAFEGQFATSGAAPVSYGCGDAVEIIEEIGGNPGPLNVRLGCGCDNKL